MKYIPIVLLMIFFIFCSIFHVIADQSKNLHKHNGYESTMEKSQKDLIIDLVSPLIANEKYISKYQKGGFTAVGVTLAANDGYNKTIKTISAWKKRFKSMNRELIHIYTVDDIITAYRQGKLGIIFHFQGSSPLDNNLDLVNKYHKLGVRVMQLTYNSRNTFGCGCEVEIDTGLTKEGYALVERMNQVGILIDVSHAGYKTALDIIGASKKPVVLSHSNAAALCPSARNVPDEVIYAIAEKDGVIGLNAFSPLITKNVPQATLDQFLDHIDYIVKLVGIDHVSLGLDYYTGQWPYVNDEEAIRNYNFNIKKGIWTADTYPMPPHKYVNGIETPDKIVNLKPALLKRGYSERDIEKIFGKNLIRVFSEVWKTK